MPTRGDGSFERLLRLYLLARRRRGLARSAEGTIVGHLRRMWAHFRRQGKHDVREVSEADVVAFARWMQQARSQRGGPFSVSYQSGCLDMVRGFFALLEARGVILQNPARGVFIPRECPLPKVKLSPDAADRLLTQPSEGTPIGKRDRALLELLYLTGLRASECCRLEISDVSFLLGTLLVRDGKGGKDRVVPIVGPAARALEQYLKEARPRLVGGPHERAVFLGCRRAPLGVSGLELMVNRHARLAGLAPLHPHALRHACATHLLRGGASVRHVQELLGHRSVNTTMRYTRVEVSDLARVIARSHPRERRREKMGQ